MEQHDLLPSHFGGHLERFLAERGVSAEHLAEATNLPHDFLAQLLTGQQILTADVALLLADFFEVSPIFWLDLQRHYCLEAREGEQARVTVAA